MTSNNYPKYWARLYPLMGIQAHGAFGNLWIHKTYRRYQSKYDYYHHCGHIITKYYYPYNPKSFLQQSNRNTFYNAVKNWQSFDYQTKNIYNEWAKYRPLLGYNRYISLYLLSNKTMIEFWESLQKNANDSTTIPQYIAQTQGDSLISGMVIKNDQQYIDGDRQWYPITGLSFGVNLVKDSNILINGNIEFCNMSPTSVQILTKIQYPTGTFPEYPYQISSMSTGTSNVNTAHNFQHIIYLYAGQNLITLLGAKGGAGGRMRINGLAVHNSLNYIILK